MSGRRDKNLRKAAEILADIKFRTTISNLRKEPFRARLRLAWKILFGRKA